MKKALLVALAALALVVTRAPQSSAGIGICDPKQSVLCVGLGEVYNFEEASDTTRFGSYGDAQLQEQDAMDVGTAAGKIGSYSASFSGSNHFHNQQGGPTFGSGYWTAALWVYPTADGADKGLLSNTSADRSITLDLYWTNSHLYPRFRALKEETLAAVSAVGDTYVTKDAWNLVVYTMSMYGDYGQARVCISVNSQATPACTSVTYDLRSSVGGAFDVGRDTLRLEVDRVDQL